MTRNRIMTSNEVRQKIGLKPSSDPIADKLVNSNISQPTETPKASTGEEIVETKKGEESQNGEV